MPYQAPIKDMLFVMNELAGLQAVSNCPAAKTPPRKPPKPCWKKARSSWPVKSPR
jgi:hypothetical protein